MTCVGVLDVVKLDIYERDCSCDIEEQRLAELYGFYYIPACAQLVRRRGLLPQHVVAIVTRTQSDPRIFEISPWGFIFVK